MPRSSTRAPVVSRSVEGPIHTPTTPRSAARAQGGAAAREGRHQARRPRRHAGLEHLAASRSWYGILGIGAIYHTVNPRLFPEQICWIVNHAEDRMMFVDLTFLPMLEKHRRQADDHRALRRAHRRSAHAGDDAEERRRLRGWIGEVDGDFAWKSFDENTAAGMCYTSAPPATRRACSTRTAPNVLHSMIAIAPDAMGVGLARCGAAGGADVPRQLLGLALSSPMMGAAW
jgi:fatty-acyl-CoA synthase